MSSTRNISKRQSKEKVKGKHRKLTSQEKKQLKKILQGKNIDLTRVIEENSCLNKTNSILVKQNNEEKNPFSFLSSHKKNHLKNDDEEESALKNCEEKEIKEKEMVKKKKEKNKKEKESEIVEKKKRGRPKKEIKIKKIRKYKRVDCKYCGLSILETNIKVHLERNHPLECEYKTEIKATKCAESIPKIFDFIYYVNFYSKLLFQLLKKEEKKSYSDQEWYIKFRSQMKKLKNIDLNLNNSYQEKFEDPIKLKESEEMKNFIPNKNFNSNFNYKL